MSRGLQGLSNTVDRGGKGAEGGRGKGDVFEAVSCLHSSSPSSLLRTALLCENTADVSHWISLIDSLINPVRHPPFSSHRRRDRDKLSAYRPVLYSNPIFRTESQSPSLVKCARLALKPNLQKNPASFEGPGSPGQPQRTQVLIRDYSSSPTAHRFALRRPYIGSSLEPASSIILLSPSLQAVSQHLGVEPRQ